MFKIGCLIVSCVSFAVAAESYADTFVVDGTGSGDFLAIQSAVDASSNGDEIIVMPGTYTSSTENVVVIKGKSISLTSSKGADVTFIDGQYNRVGINCIGNKATSIEGFTLSHCAGVRGGGMISNQSNIVVRDCVFNLNTSAERGGGAYCMTSSVISFADCEFADNQANNGGGVAGIESMVSLTDCNFTQNNSTSSGGAVRMYPGSSLTASRTEFSNNTSSIGGAVRLFGVEALSNIENCTFVGNTASKGAALALNNTSFAVVHCVFTDNTAGDIGGAIHRTGNNSYAEISASFFCQNFPDHIYGYEADDSNVFYDECPSECDEDLNSDYVVDVLDLLLLIQAWGSCDDCPEDMNNNGVVEVNDLMVIIAAWGICS